MWCYRVYDTVGARQGDEGGAENRATTFPSAKMTVACSHVHRVGKGRSCEISYFNPSSLPNKFLQSLVRLIVCLMSHISYWAWFPAPVAILFKTGLPSSSGYDPKPKTFRKPPSHSKPFLSQSIFQPLCYQFYIYKHWHYLYKRDQELLASEIFQITLFPTRNVPVSNLTCNPVGPNCMKVIRRTRLVHISHSRRT